MNKDREPGRIRIVRAEEAAPDRQPPVRYKVPFPATPLIGREELLASILDLLSGHEARVLSLTGAPGIGKTRLAIEAAHLATEFFPDGVCFVPLAAVPSPELVLPTIAQSLGLRVIATRSLCEGLADFLSDKNLLLVLDNFDHLLSAACDVSEIVAASPALKVLVTSRSRLNVYGENEVTVTSLQLPEANSRLVGNEQLAQLTAVRLFASRAQAANRNFRLTERNCAAAAEICAHLDGIPLAIELAAARTRLLSPQDILERLKQPGQRLRFLTGGAADMPARQQTLRQAIQWSYDLLSEGEKRLFRQLAVFSGGFSLDAAEAICEPPFSEAHEQQDLLDLLARLVTYSLVQVQDQGSRFLILETIREYALERLAESGEAEVMARRHALYFARLAESIDARLAGGTHPPGTWELLDRLDVEKSNLRTALNWSTTGDIESGTGGQIEIGLRLAGALWFFWEYRNHANEGRRWCEVLLAANSDDASAYSNKVTFVLGRLADYAGDHATARSCYESSLAGWRRQGDTWGTSLACIALGQCTQRDGDQAAALALLTESFRLRVSLAHDWGTAMALLSLSRAAKGREEYSAALDLLAQALTLARQSGNDWCLSQCLEEQASVFATLGERDRALGLLEESFAIGLRTKDLGLMAGCVTTATRIAITEGRFAQAARLLGAADFLIELKEAGVVCHRDSLLAGEVRAGLDGVTFDTLWAEGRHIPLPDIPPLLAAIRTDVHSPQRYVRPSTLMGLTPREFEVLQLIAQGLSNAEISRNLVISPNTVSMHMRSIFSKLGVSSRSAATRYAFVHNLVQG